MFFVKLAAFRDTARNTVLPGAGSVPGAGGLVFSVRPDASRGQTQAQDREDYREEGEDVVPSVPRAGRTAPTTQEREA